MRLLSLHLGHLWWFDGTGAGVLKLGRAAHSAEEGLYPAAMAALYALLELLFAHHFIGSDAWFSWISLKAESAVS